MYFSPKTTRFGWILSSVQHALEIPFPELPYLLALFSFPRILPILEYTDTAFLQRKNNMLIDLSHGAKTVNAYLRIVNQTEIEGYRFSSGWAKNEKIFFVARFSKPFEYAILSKNKHCRNGRDHVRGAGNMPSLFLLLKKQPLIRVKGKTDEGNFVHAVLFNGKPLEKPFVRHHQLMQGGHLIFIMGKKPNPLWIKR